MDEYSSITLLSKEGSYSVVYTGKCKDTNRTVVIKKMQDKITAKKEVEILKMLQDCPYIVTFYTRIEQMYQYNIIMEYIDGWNLLKYGIIDDYGDAKHIFKQIALAIQHCHKNNVIHNDIKPDNIMIDKNKNVKLIDFGLSQLTTDKLLFRGSPLYAAPEIFKKTNVSTKIDIYSFGITMYESIYGYCPHDNGSDELFEFQQKAIHNEICYKHPNIIICNSFINMLKLALNKDYTKRGSIEALLETEFFMM